MPQSTGGRAPFPGSLRGRARRRPGQDHPGPAHDPASAPATTRALLPPQVSPPRWHSPGHSREAGAPLPAPLETPRVVAPPGEGTRTERGLGRQDLLEPGKGERRTGRGLGAWDVQALWDLAGQSPWVLAV